MAIIATIDSKSTGHDNFPPQKAVEDEPEFTINGKPVMLDGDHFDYHTDGETTHNGYAIASQSWLTVNGRAVVCVGDRVSCGGKVATGDASMTIG